MNESAVIDKSIVADKSVDIEALKAEGIKRIQELAGNNWTDYNFHDPGVTILETLCYALADLAYRAEFDITDILYPATKKKIENTLFQAHEVLTTSPLSKLDFKGMILDLEGVKNCEIVPSYCEKVISGSFDVKIEIHPDFDDDSRKFDIKKSVNDLITANRPIGVVFNEVTFFDFDSVGIIVDIELKEEIESKKVFVEFLRNLQNYFSPEIKFKSLQELIDKGVPMESVFCGPLLKNGFLLDEEITNHSIRNQIYISDLMSLVMGLEGVSFVRQLKVVGSDKERYNWIYDVKNGKVPKLDPLSTSFVCRYKGVMIFESNPKSIELILSSKTNHQSAHTQNKLLKRVGSEKNLNKYYSIQNDFPETYGIGVKGPAAGASPDKLAAIKQFKGYLMIYDQIMANFLSQLNHIKFLFSTEDIDTSYAVQLMDDIPGIEYMYKQFVENYFVDQNDFNDKRKLKSEWLNFLKNSKESLKQKIQTSFESDDEFLNRRNRVLDHLLARFGINTIKFEMLSSLNSAEAITYKLNLLRQFPKLSYEKYAMGPSSINNSLSGLKCWLYTNLNLRGDGETEISSIEEKIGKTSTLANLRIEVYANDKPLNTFLKYGVETENLVETINNEVLIYNNDNEVVSRIFVDNLKLGITKELLANKIFDLDKGSENFIVIDHLEIKPTDEMPCYGFDVVFENKPFFVTERKYSLSECDLFSEEFAQGCQKNSNFEILESSLKEFRIKFQCSFGSLLTKEYYSSVNEALEQLEYFLYSLKDKNPIFSYATKYENHYVNVSNPFSHIVTVILPTWPSKFQNPGFKKYIEDFICEELPAHLVVNVKWLDLQDLKTFEMCWNEYLNKTASQDIQSKMQSLDNIMKALVS
jgi:hypothetical protein